MLRYFLSNRLLTFGVLFVGVCVVGSLLYSAYLTRQSEEDLAKTEQALLSLQGVQTDRGYPQNDNDAETEALSEPQLGMSSTTVFDTQAADDGIPSETQEAAELFAVDTDASLDALPPRQRLSPFGLGIFPEIPADYPDQNVWERLERAAHDPEGGKKLELLIRVRMKLWEQGTETVGASYDDRTKLIYPNIPGVVYVEWAYMQELDGTFTRYASGVSGAAGAAAAEPYLKRGEDPPGITVIPYEEAGIDPYTFLEFKYE